MSIIRTKEQIKELKDITKNFTEKDVQNIEQILKKEENKRDKGTPIYDSLLKRKNMGEQLNFNDISRDELEQLWRYESMSDNIIANLFKVGKSKVTYKRNKLGITMGHSYYVGILQKYIKGELKDIEEI